MPWMPIPIRIRQNEADPDPQYTDYRTFQLLVIILDELSKEKPIFCGQIPNKKIKINISSSN
jgi:hypothetical protein